jgi:thiamine pyrophosphate-dependent acetolactate synthase large subunit-like protein
MSLLIIEYLKLHKIDKIFGIPGGPILKFLSELSSQKDIKWINGTNELNACFMAQGWSRSKNVPGCVFFTSGPGIATAINPIKNSYDEHYPLLVMSALNDNDDGDPSRWQYLNPQSFETFVNGIFKIKTKQDLLESFDKIINLANNGTKDRPWSGPVIILFSPDFFKINIENIHDIKINKPTHKKHNLDFLRPLMVNKNICVLIGGAIDTQEKKEYTKLLYDKWKIPFVHTWKGKEILNDYGMVGTLGTHLANYITLTSDLILEIGDYSISIESEFYYNKFGNFLYEKDRILFSNIPDKIKIKNTKVIYLNVMETLLSLLDLDIPKVSEKWINDITIFNNNICDIPRTVINKNIFATEHIMNILSYYVKNDVVVTGVGNHWFSAGKYITPRKWLSWTNWASIGCGYPVGFGYSIGNIDNETVWILEGDGGLYWNLSIFSERFNKYLNNKSVRIVLTRDKKYGAVESAFKMYNLENNQTASLKEYDNISIKELCKLFKIKYYLIKSFKKLIKILQEIDGKKEMILLDLEVENNKIFEINLDKNYIDALLNNNIKYLRKINKIYTICSSESL